MFKSKAFILLVLSIICLISSIIILFIGSNKSRVFNQMSEAIVISSLEDINNAGIQPFLLHGYLELSHVTIIDNMVAYKTENKIIAPQLNIKLVDGFIDLFKNYSLADFNITKKIDQESYKGIKPGGDITIYAANYTTDTFYGINGYELYPGTPKQYLQFLSSPYNSYMNYVRIFIGIALLFFLVSIVFNIKK